MSDDTARGDEIPRDEVLNNNAQSVTDDLEPSVLSWANEVLGAPLLSYLLSCDEDSLSRFEADEVALTDKQQFVVSQLRLLRRQAATLPEPELARTVALATLGNRLNSDVSAATYLRHLTAGDEQHPPTGDDAERALVEAAYDIYSAFLMPAEPDPIPAPFQTSGRVSSRVLMALYRSPYIEAFAQAVMQKPKIGEKFVAVNDQSGPVATVYRNIGSGGSTDLGSILGMVLNNAWNHIKGGEVSPEIFALEALKEWRLIERLLLGKNGTAVAKTAFMGALLPPGVQFNIGNLVVRPVREDERETAPPSLRGQLQGSDSSGVNTIINYDGDIVLEQPFTYKVRLSAGFGGRGGDGAITQWPQDMYPPQELDRASLRLRFSLMMAVERTERPQLVQTWRSYDEPFNQNGGASWNDPRQGTAIMPIQLTEADVSAWKEWYQKLDQPSAARIELALSRILRAIAERREPSDVLIDSVIAWENLFGTKEGEPTFRVTSCLAKLLADSLDERQVMRKKFAEIYSLRSKVVHGSRNLKQDEYPMCQEALNAAIATVKKLLSDRADVLDLPDGVQRSYLLLLGE